MHEYYKKNEKKLHKTMLNFLKNIRSELEEKLDMNFEDIMAEVWNVYKNKYLENMPYIGGDKAQNTKNMTGAFVYISMGDVVRKHGLSLEEWGELTTTCYERFFSNFPKFALKFMGNMYNNPKKVKKMMTKKEAFDKQNQKVNPDCFVTEMKEPYGDYSSVYYMTSCGITNYAKKIGCEEYLPYMCNLDYIMFAKFGVGFERTCTCADGDGYCNFCIRKDKKITPYWPCHASNPNDPLK